MIFKVSSVQILKRGENEWQLVKSCGKARARAKGIDGRVLAGLLEMADTEFV